MNADTKCREIFAATKDEIVHILDKGMTGYDILSVLSEIRSIFVAKEQELKKLDSN